jgi:hypothetical protein
MTASFPPEYFTARFRTPLLDGWPERFVVVTAYATTGRIWTPERNAAADRALGEELARRGGFLRRAEGYSPHTGHAEPGYAVDLDAPSGCALGLRYLQDAIYVVVGDALAVMKCADPRLVAPVGSFRARLDLVVDS